MGRKSHQYKRINQYDYVRYIAYYQVVMTCIFYPRFHFCVRMPLRAIQAPHGQPQRRYRLFRQQVCQMADILCCLRLRVNVFCLPLA